MNDILRATPRTKGSAISAGGKDSFDTVLVHEDTRADELGLEGE